MDRNEKILMIQSLLEDVRGNWGYEVEERVIEAKELCLELGGDFNTLAEACNEFLNMEPIDRDGRYFREVFPYGYEEMDSLHNLLHTFCDKSKEFQEIAEMYLTYPENRFEDYSAEYIK